MSKIKAKNTKPELLVRKYLFNKSFQYRINVRSLPGKPDIVLHKYKTVIFINGCFWHGHQGCKYSTLPKTRTEWWTTKILKNKERDQKEHEELKQAGWNIIIVWGCQLKPKVYKETLEKIVLLIRENGLTMQKHIH